MASSELQCKQPLFKNCIQAVEACSFRHESQSNITTIIQVGSTNSAATAAAVAAAGWASWAVGAVTAKFYKSPAGAMPGSAGGSQEVCQAFKGSYWMH